MFNDRPTLPRAEVRKIAIEGSYALVSWTLGENAGGLMALVKIDGAWEVLPRVGRGMPLAQDLSDRTGMPLEVAFCYQDLRDKSERNLAGAMEMRIPGLEFGNLKNRLKF